MSKVYDSLITLDPDTMSIMPRLAESFETGTWVNFLDGHNGAKFTFHLRDDVYWHDGVPFTSEDVKFTIDYLLQYYDPLGFPPYDMPAPSACSYVGAVDFVEAPDPYTVIVYLNAKANVNAKSYWLIYSFIDLLIIPKHVWQNISKEDALSLPIPDPNLVGTGPFKFVPPLRRQGVTLVANRNYFRYCPIQTSIAVKSYMLNPYSDLTYNVTVKNCFSDRDVTTTVTICFDDSLQQNPTLTLPFQTQVTLGPFTIYSIEPGMHEIRVEHTNEPYSNRTCVIHKHVCSTTKEDINLDTQVDMKDISTAAKAFGSVPDNPRWSSVADINGDGEVDMKDIASVAKKFGWPAQRHEYATAC